MIDKGKFVYMNRKLKTIMVIVSSVIAVLIVSFVICTTRTNNVDERLFDNMKYNLKNNEIFHLTYSQPYFSADSSSAYSVTLKNNGVLEVSVLNKDTYTMKQERKNLTENEFSKLNSLIEKCGDFQEDGILCSGTDRALIFLWTKDKSVDFTYNTSKSVNEFLYQLSAFSPIELNAVDKSLIYDDKSFEMMYYYGDGSNSDYSSVWFPLAEPTIKKKAYIGRRYDKESGEKVNVLLYDDKILNMFVKAQWGELLCREDSTLPSLKSNDGIEQIIITTCEKEEFIAYSEKNSIIINKEKDIETIAQALKNAPSADVDYSDTENEYFVLIKFRGLNALYLYKEIKLARSPDGCLVFYCVDYQIEIEINNALKQAIISYPTQSMELKNFLKH